MPALDFLPPWTLQLINSNWGATIIGWILGGFSAWWAARRQARLQAETIRALTAALDRFSDQFKDNLDPLSDDEKTQLGDARDAFLLRDSEPSEERVFFRAAKFPAAWLVGTAIACALAIYFKHPAFVTSTLILGLITLGALFAFRITYRNTWEAYQREALGEAQNALQAMSLNERQFDHLRRWALNTTFSFLARTNVLRRIDIASVNTRRAAKRKAQALKPSQDT